jgi:hypothetical protein
MRRISYILLSALLLATTIVGPHEVLAQGAKKKKKPVPPAFFADPVTVANSILGQFEELVGLVSCRACGWLNCSHPLKHGGTRDIYWKANTSLAAWMIEELVGHTPRTPFQALNQGYRVLQWERKVTFCYGPARCSCAKPVTNECAKNLICEGWYPGKASFILLELKSPIAWQYVPRIKPNANGLLSLMAEAISDPLAFLKKRTDLSSWGWMGVPSSMMGPGLKAHWRIKASSTK